MPDGSPQPFEYREPVLIAGDRLAIDQAGTHLEPVNGLDDERISRCPIVPVPGLAGGRRSLGAPLGDSRHAWFRESMKPGGIWRARSNMWKTE